MNEKLTAEQRVNDILVWVLRARRNPALADDRDFRESFLQNFGKTAHTAEDECICNLDPDDTCPVKIFNEDCPIHGYEYEEVDLMSKIEDAMKIPDYFNTTEDEPKKHWQKCRCEDGFPPYPDCWCQAHTAEDEPSRYQTALEVQAEYLKELNKYSKEKSWEEGQSQSGLFMWLSEKITGG